MRVTVDKRDENIGTKIKASRLERIPYTFIIGDKETENKSVTIRSRKEGELPDVKLDEALAKIFEENDTKAK